MSFITFLILYFCGGAIVTAAVGIGAGFIAKRILDKKEEKLSKQQREQVSSEDEN